MAASAVPPHLKDQYFRSSSLRALARPAFLPSFVAFFKALGKDRQASYHFDDSLLKNMTLPQVQELLSACPELMARQVVAAALF